MRSQGAVYAIATLKLPICQLFSVKNIYSLATRRKRRSEVLPDWPCPAKTRQRRGEASLAPTTTTIIMSDVCHVFG